MTALNDAFDKLAKTVMKVKAERDALLNAAKNLENWLNSNQEDPMNRAQVEDARSYLRDAIAKAEQ